MAVHSNPPGAGLNPVGVLHNRVEDVFDHLLTLVRNAISTNVDSLGISFKRVAARFCSRYGSCNVNLSSQVGTQMDGRAVWERSFTLTAWTNWRLPEDRPRADQARS